jgi:hypothetical protein
VTATNPPTRHTKLDHDELTLSPKAVTKTAARLPPNLFNHNTLNPHRSYHVDTFLQQGHSNTSQSVRQSEEVPNSDTQALTATPVELLISAEEGSGQIFPIVAISIDT